MIDIGICAGLKSDNYIPILINSLKKKAKYPDNLNIIICKNETINISDDFFEVENRESKVGLSMRTVFPPITIKSILVLILCTKVKLS